MSNQKYEPGAQEKFMDWIFTLGIINGSECFSHAVSQIIQEQYVQEQKMMVDNSR